VKVVFREGNVGIVHFMMNCINYYIFPTVLSFPLFLLTAWMDDFQIFVARIAVSPPFHG